MTIREYLKERAAHINGKCIPMSGLALVSAVFARGNVFLAVMTVVMVCGTITTFVVFMRRTPCPRCSLPLGTVAMRWKSNSYPAPRCPHCGISIDEPISGPSKA